MTSLAISYDNATAANPLDLVEQIIDANDWAFDRRSDSDMAAEAPGKWCDYGLYFSWSHEISVMHFSCAFDLKAPVKRRTALYELLAKANEKLWIGHFGMDEDTGMPIYRHSILLRGTPTASAESIEDLVDIGLTECERFFPAFQFALWEGKSPDDALEAAMLECVGEA
ncbi:MAG TPA: YbjN domain-containing protein [Acidocella sp.]|nr:YbjN domain-containing protein [Acidocella sp.]